MILSRAVSDQGRALRVGVKNISSDGDAFRMPRQVRNLFFEALREADIISIHPADKISTRHSDPVVQSPDDPRVGAVQDTNTWVGGSRPIEDSFGMIR